MLVRCRRLQPTKSVVGLPWNPNPDAGGAGAAALGVSTTRPISVGRVQRLITSNAADCPWRALFFFSPQRGVNDNGSALPAERVRELPAKRDRKPVREESLLVLLTATKAWRVQW